jgi:phospholipid transport system substrate-binding protein
MATITRGLRWPALWLLAVVAGGVLASSEPPDALVKRTVEDVLQVIERTPQRRALQRLAEQKVLPHFDFRQMTRLAVGPNWRKASAEQQAALESEFRRLLVNLYTAALSKSGQRRGARSLEVRSPAPGANPRDTVVKTVVREPDGQRVAIDYRMALRDGEWKVYDVLVEGVSLVTTYRTSFEREVQAHGVDGLIHTLERKNGTARSQARRVVWA